MSQVMLGYILNTIKIWQILRSLPVGNGTAPRPTPVSFLRSSHRHTAVTLVSVLPDLFLSIHSYGWICGKHSSAFIFPWMISHWTFLWGDVLFSSTTPVLCYLENRLTFFLTFSWAIPPLCNHSSLEGSWHFPMCSLLKTRQQEASVRTYTHSPSSPG